MVEKKAKDLTPLQGLMVMIVMISVVTALLILDAPRRRQEEAMAEQSADDRACTDLYNQNPLSEADRADVDAALALHGC